MASILTHYLVGEKFIEKYRDFSEEEKISFLVGSIAADTPNSQGKGIPEREKSHFGSSPSMALLKNGNFDLSGNVLDYDSFLEKYGTQLDHPFIEGYLLHLYTDKKWFQQIITNLLDTQASIIKEGAENSNDLTFQEAIGWYTKNLYSTYDAHDLFFASFLDLEHIRAMSHYNIDSCPIEEIDKQDLKKLLKQLEVKCESLKTRSNLESSDPLIPFDTILSFIDDCATEAHQLYFKCK